ncbi:hypothetical protein JAAARDRAFT_174578 [Jaapia argillacea MUCL 33604]|uniref:Major facilitator superfamily (MFS) profile domain-containing protein n=1 Tax=Jaapia argillacea MUCL 33604 TaxID=933084 RepID=A0A067QAD8_9AGAM|nr:hypothetical protein JAAARDRAFT_174578 [Jaapia argillacea MUCL 33604]
MNDRNGDPPGTTSSDENLQGNALVGSAASGTNTPTNENELEKSLHDEPQTSVTQPKLHSVFTKRQKWFIVVMAAIAGMFSPFTINIYFPAIPTIAAAFHKTVELINLSVTVYMVLQGVSPMLWGTLADRVGRRPIFLVCLFILALACVGLGLVPTSAYWLLLLLRALQAAGCSSTISVAAGVIGDIADPSERGGFFGVFNIGPMAGPSIGPIIGGVLAGSLGWRSIFWFLCIASMVCFFFILLFFPETLRAIVGDGSIRPSKPRLYSPLIPFVTYRSHESLSPPATESSSKRPKLNPFLLFLRPEILLPLIYMAIPFAVLNTFTATMASLFGTAYPWLTESEIGLCYLAIGGGMLCGGVFGGRLLDWDYRRIKNEIESEREKNVEGQVDEDFPIEKARMRMLPYFLLVAVGSCMGYGWCLQSKVNIAAPLILQVIFGFFSNVSFTGMQTLLIDMAPTQGASVTACNNITRCITGAVLVSVVDLILNALGPGWSYVLFGGIIACGAIPLIFVEMKMGPQWRRKRRMSGLL